MQDIELLHTIDIIVKNVITEQGRRQLFRTGRDNKVKTKELQFGSRGRVREGDMPPPARSAEAKFFFQNPRGVREQIRVIFK